MSLRSVLSAAPSRHPRRVLAVAATVAVLAVSACGSGGSDTGSGSTATSTTASTRVVESTFTGEKVEIPTEPKRVVALWRTGSELADLGVVPVAALEGEFLEEELSPEVWATVKDVPTVGTFEGVDVEKVIAADPDLIVGMDRGALGIDYKELAEVAPTVILKIAEPTDVWDNYPKLADIVGRSSDFEAKQAEVDKQLAAIKSEYGAGLAGKEVTHFSVADNSIWVSTSKSLVYRRMDAAGFVYNPAYTDSPERYVTELAMENIASLNDQYALFYAVDLAGNVDAETQKVLDSASFKRLPAAQAGRAFPLTSGTIYTFQAAGQQVEDLRAAAEKMTG